ncbi:MAG: DUF2922 family protein [Selenomonadaceae bacterium]|nr:DUF2922 family protein [Selenomonadaceae bacterium]
MADKVTTNNVLKLAAAYSDGSTRTFSVDNPKVPVAAADINSLGAYIKEHEVFVNDSGATFDAFTNAKLVEDETTKLDLTSN